MKFDDIFGFFKKKQPPSCPCGNAIGKSKSIINYKYYDPDIEEFVVNSMPICNKCSEEMDEEAESKDIK
jgi:hypothetical protein